MNLFFYEKKMPESIFILKIFQWLDKLVIKNIINNCESREYKDWEMIIMEGEDSNWEGYILKNWRVSISIWWNHIVDLSSWDIFGEIALLNEEERTATVYSQWDIEVIVLRLPDIIKMISLDDTINKTVIERIEENLER
jgi:CRP-like cAMP-binding protein